MSSARHDAPLLETERLRLRAWADGDLDGYAQLVADPEVMRHMGSGARFRATRAAGALLPPLTRAEARVKLGRLVRHWRRHAYGEWAVEDRDTGSLLGSIGLKHHPDWVADASNVEIGWLLDREAWGRGLATEGARAALDHAFGELRIERIISIALPENGRSRRVMERLGMTPQGETRWRGGHFLWYAIERAEWERERATAPQRQVDRSGG